MNTDVIAHMEIFIACQGRLYGASGAVYATLKEVNVLSVKGLWHIKSGI